MALLLWLALVFSYAALPWVVYRGVHVPSGRSIVVKATGYEVTRAVSELEKAAALQGGGGGGGEDPYTLYPLVLAVLLLAILAGQGWLVTLASLAGLYLVYEAYRTLPGLVSGLLAMRLVAPQHVEPGVGLYASALLLLILAVAGPSVGRRRRVHTWR